jgi:protein CpxP
MMRAPAPSSLAVLLLATVSLPALAQPNPAATQPFAPAAAPAPTAPPVASPPPAVAPAAAVTQAQSQVQVRNRAAYHGTKDSTWHFRAAEPQWTAFTQVMRENAQTADTLFRQRAAGVQSMNALTNMQSYAQISRAYADGSEKFITAFQAMYAVLSERQKLSADRLFRQQATRGAQQIVAKPRWFALAAGRCMNRRSGKTCCSLYLTGFWAKETACECGAQFWHNSAEDGGGSGRALQTAGRR